jgi:hypothetical protein
MGIARTTFRFVVIATFDRNKTWATARRRNQR